MLIFSRSPASVALAALFAAALFAVPSGAEAGDKEEAQKHFKAGTELMKVEDFKGAVAEFEESVKILPTKNALFNYGNCLKALHRYGEALDAFERLEQEYGRQIDAEMRRAIDRHVKDIRAVIAELTIRVDRPGASVVVDGRDVGQSPLSEPLVLGPGPHTLEISAGGYDAVRIEVTMVSGERKVESVELAPVSAELTVTANVAGAQVEIDGGSVGEIPLAEPLTVGIGEHFVRVTLDGYQEIERKVDIEPGERRTLDFTLMPASEAGGDGDVGESRVSPLFWVGFSTTLACGVAAGAIWGATAKKYREFEEENGDYEAMLEDGTWPQSEIDLQHSDVVELKDDVNKRRNVAVGFSIAAGALAVLTGVVLAIDLSDDEEPDPVEVSAAPGGVALSF